MHTRLFQTLTGALVAVAALTTVSAHAEGLYAGGSLGSPSYRDTVNGIDGSGSGLSGKLYGGWQVLPNLALEAGAADLGHIDQDAGKVDGRAVFFDAVGSAPLNDEWSLLGRIGVAHANLDTSAGDSSGTGLKLGLGAQYALNSTVALRGEWERYRPSVFGDRPNIDEFTFGVRVGF